MESHFYPFQSPSCQARSKPHSCSRLVGWVVALWLGLTTLTNAQLKAAEVSTPSAADGAVVEQRSERKQSRPDLVGHVKAGQGMPEATVFIWTAGPRVGTSTFCPSCYADCGKHAKTDAQGAFKIESLDPQLLFRILAVAKGFRPKFLGKVDPAKGPVTVDLEPVAASDASPDRSIRGKVVDAEGKPVYGATVEAHGLRKSNDGGGRYGTLPGVDPLAVTDETGEFLLTAREAFYALDVRVEARGFAHKGFNELTSGTTVHKLVLTEGASVAGRIVWQGKPLAGVSVGLAGADRSAESFVGHFDVGTDAQGRFLFVNMPPDVDYFIYGMMDGLKKYGALPQQPVHVGKDGSTTEAGDLAVIPGFRLAGEVVLADGQPVPPKTRLLLGRDSAWDSMQLVLDREGRFETTGIPQETVSLSVRVPGYRISARNASMDRMNPFRLIGRVEHDITNLVFLLEKGKDPGPDLGANLPSSAWPQNRPLRGAEGTAEHSDQWMLAGQVRDSETHEAIRDFRLTPGNIEPMLRRSYWDRRNAVQGTNGNFIAYLDQHFGQPALKVEADGYLPTRFNVLPESQTNLQITLHQGAGPHGRVLLPDGKAAATATLGLLCAGEDDVRLGPDGHLHAFRNRDRVQIADPDGGFSFAPELDMQGVVAVAEAGFKRVSLQELATNSDLVLEPWGQLNGVLHRAGAAATNEDLDLAFQGDSGWFLELHAKTDGQGQFHFDRVPPGRLVLNGRQMLSQHGWSVQALQQVQLKPGQTLEVTLDAPARPAVAQDLRPFPTTRNASHPTRKPGPGPKGFLVTPEGKPVEGVEVALLVTGKYVALGHAALQGSQAEAEGLLVHSGTDGAFTLPNEEAATGVVAVHQQGYAQVSLEELKRSPRLVLQPWGRIEGTLRIGRQLGTNQVVVLEPELPGMGGPFYDASNFQARTDDQGRFIMTFVPPGERKLARLIPLGATSWQHGPGTLVQVKAGVVTQVTVGGTGRTVVGKAHLTEGPAQVNWSYGQATLHTMLPKQLRHWTQSAEGREAMRRMRVFPLELAADGSFRAEEVLPGEYELDIVLSKSPGRVRDPSDFLGRFHQQVVVPKAPGSEADAPFDLGTIEGKLEPISMAGAPARGTHAPPVK